MKTRKSLVKRIDQKLSEFVPKNLGNEHTGLAEEVVKWLKSWAKNKDFEIDVEESKGKVITRHTITLKYEEEEENSYVVCIHDPFKKVVGAAESITGADYAVEHPVDDKEDKFLLVQLKTESYGAPPKQFFELGAVYMYSQYLAGESWWNERLKNGARYVTKRESPHNEFLFLKILNEKNAYIPFSSVLRTYRFGSYELEEKLNGEKPEVKINEPATLAEFSDSNQHLAGFYTGFKDFNKAAENCDIGILHSAEPNWKRRKMNTLFFLSKITRRPNVSLLEVRSNLFDEVVRGLT